LYFFMVLNYAKVVPLAVSLDRCAKAVARISP
jgi:hypothetical protein